MTGRALVFSNPEIVRRLTRSFIPYAGDKWYLQRQEDEDGAYFRKVAGQRYGGEIPEGVSAQGLYVATPDGRLLRSDHFHPDPKRVAAMLDASLAEWKPGPNSTPLPTRAATDGRLARTPPEGGLILNVFTRIPQRLTFGAQWTPNHATGRDHMWITRDEGRSLLPREWRKGASAPVPQAVAERLARFHLTDNVRGEPPMWRREDLRRAAMTLTVEDPAAGRLKLSGTVELRHGDERGYVAKLQGYLTYDRKRERFTRFDALSWGEAWGEGPFTKGAPTGKFPLVVAFSLAGNSPADRVPPQASRDYQSYFSTGRASR